MTDPINIALAIEARTSRILLILSQVAQWLRRLVLKSLATAMGMREVAGEKVSMAKITVTVKLFAAYQEALGVPELTMELPTGSTVVAVRDRLLIEYPELEPWRDVTRFGINLQFVAPDTPLKTGDEVVLIPPVSGG